MTIENIVKQVKSATDWQINKRLLRERVQTDLLLPHGGGLFKITPDFIAFLNSWESETIYLEDTYQNPIEVNRQELLYEAKEHYQRVMNRWHQEHEELRKIRRL
jgi:hypothetical protein